MGSSGAARPAGAPYDRWRSSPARRPPSRGPPGGAQIDRIPALIIASWYPAVESVYRGRFVADQASALLATGRVAPVVVSFELARVSGDAALRAEQRQAVRDRRRAAVASSDRLFAPSGWGGASGIPVARLPVAHGSSTGEDGDDHADAVADVVDRLTQTDAGAARVPVIHAQQGFPDGHAAAVVARRLGWPLVVTEHYSRVDARLADEGSAARYTGALGAAARVIAVSRAQAAALASLVPAVAPKLSVVPNPVPVEQFPLAGPAERVGGELLYVGNRKEDKGIELLLGAFARARATRPDLVLRLIGSSPTDAIESRWHRLARELGVAEATRFEGSGDRGTVAAAMRRADVLVHASRRETFGVVAAEGLATGLPVVATDSGGVTEILQGGAPALGAVVRGAEPEAFASAVLGVLGRRDTFDPAAMRRSIEERYGPATVAARIVDVYEDVRGSAPPGAPGVDPALPGLVSTRRAERGVLVAFGRSHAAQVVGSVEPRARARIEVLTAREAEATPFPGGSAGIHEVDLDPAFRRALREPGAERWRRIPDVLLRTDRFARKRYEIARRRLELRLPAAAAAARDAAAHDGEVVALDALDHLALDRAGVTPEPGGLRWLADGWADES